MLSDQFNVHFCYVAFVTKSKRNYTPCGNVTLITSPKVIHDFRKYWQTDRDEHRTTLVERQISAELWVVTRFDKMLIVSFKELHILLQMIFYIWHSPLSASFLYWFSTLTIYNSLTFSLQAWNLCVSQMFPTVVVSFYLRTDSIDHSFCQFLSVAFFMPLTVQSMEMEALCFRLSVRLYPGQNHSLTSLPSTYSFHIIFHFWFCVDCLFGILSWIFM